MSKLRADITWKHRINSDSSILTPLSIITNIEEKNNDEDEIEDSANREEKEKEEEEEDDDDDDENLENEFNKYLQGWSEMLEEETYEFEESENEMLDDIPHPAIDNNAKWELNLLFK